MGPYSQVWYRLYNMYSAIGARRDKAEARYPYNPRSDKHWIRQVIAERRSAIPNDSKHDRVDRWRDFERLINQWVSKTEVSQYPPASAGVPGTSSILHMDEPG